jgi:hypothetical protein
MKGTKAGLIGEHHIDEGPRQHSLIAIKGVLEKVEKEDDKPEFYLSNEDGLFRVHLGTKALRRFIDRKWVAGSTHTFKGYLRTVGSKKEEGVPPSSSIEIVLRYFDAGFLPKYEGTFFVAGTVLLINSHVSPAAMGIGIVPDQVDPLTGKERGKSKWLKPFTVWVSGVDGCLKKVKPGAYIEVAGSLSKGNLIAEDIKIHCESPWKKACSEAFGKRKSKATNKKNIEPGSKPNAKKVSVKPIGGKPKTVVPSQHKVEKQPVRKKLTFQVK